MKKILIISGKGGTGKTTLSSSLIELLNAKAFADCDVDAPNLHLVSHYNDSDKLEQDFQGMDIFSIDNTLCKSCGKCYDVCKFSAIEKDDNKFKINPLLCEGCGVCEFICKYNAIKPNKNIVGKTQIYKSEKVFSTAQLNMGSGNSGKLVSQVKKNLDDNTNNHKFAIIDGSPGIGCPVIASLSAIDLAIIVTEPSLSGLSDLKRIVTTAKIFKTKISIVINKANLNKSVRNMIKNYLRLENLELIGEIDYDENVSKLINKNQSLANSNTVAATQIKKIANKLIYKLDSL
ncbi:MAG: ATPase [Spirochaetia bacterium]|nr:ATPase [Spirochaetia bacterium]